MQMLCPNNKTQPSKKKHLKYVCEIIVYKAIITLNYIK